MQSGSQQYRSFERSRDRQENAASLDAARLAGMCRNGRPAAGLVQRTSPQTDRRGDLEVPPAASDERAPDSQSSSVSIFSQGLHSETAVVVHGIPSSVSREAIASVLSRFGSIRRVKHIKFPHSKKTRCLVDFSGRGAAQHLIQVGFIRYADKFLKVSDPKKIARLQAEPERSGPGRCTICVWGPQGRTEIPRTEPRVIQTTRPGRATQVAAWPTARTETEAGGPGVQSIRESETQVRPAAGAEPGANSARQGEEAGVGAGHQDFEVRVE
jgi:hypothetical protein